jgi:Bacterial extracellular solute-binding protein
MIERYTRREALKFAAASATIATSAGVAAQTAQGNASSQAYAPRVGGLEWPKELARKATATDSTFSARASNYVLDFHGDPVAAKLVVFSDGNHHMALEQALQTFLTRNPDVVDIFYSTTPPRVPSELLEKGKMHLGNLTLSVKPHVFISPPNVLKTLSDKQLVQPSRPMMKSRGQVLLVRRGNPKKIFNVADVARADVRLFISNPKTEAASYVVYKETLQRLARAQNVALDFLDDSGKDGAKIYYGALIHHREAPEAVAGGQADVAMVYYHLALRYTRIFPETFDLVFPDGSFENKPASEQHVVSSFNISLVGDGGAWGAKFVDFMMSRDAQQIYEYHGLARA